MIINYYCNALNDLLTLKLTLSVLASRHPEDVYSESVIKRAVTKYVDGAQWRWAFKPIPSVLPPCPVGEPPLKIAKLAGFPSPLRNLKHLEILDPGIPVTKSWALTFFFKILEKM